MPLRCIGDYFFSFFNTFRCRFTVRRVHKTGLKKKKNEGEIIGGNTVAAAVVQYDYRR